MVERSLVFYFALVLLLVIIFGHTGHETERVLTCLLGLVLIVGIMRQ